MMKIDTDTWKSFRVVDLGFSVYHGQRLNKAQRIEGETPFITAGFENRGVTQYIGNDRPTYHKAITVDMFGNCFFQSDDCAGDDNVYFFVNDDVNDLLKLFISAGIGAMTFSKFDYARQFRQGDADDLEVMLPATSDGEPDWAYMERYMRDVVDREEIFAEHLASLTAEAVADGHAIDTSAWKAFRVVGDDGLFSTYSRGQVAVVRNLVDGDMPYVGAVFPDRDNAITRYVAPNKPSQVSPGNSIACVCDGAAIGTQTYQADDFVGTTNLKILHAADLNEYRALFLVTALNAACKQCGYSYFDKRNDEAFCAEAVMLPTTPDGDPDWAFMEAYMKSVMEREAMFADELDKLVM